MLSVLVSANSKAEMNRLLGLLEDMEQYMDSGAKTMEVCVVRQGGKKEMLKESDIQEHVDEIEASMEEEKKPTE